jgi:hypothetical protein
MAMPAVAPGGSLSEGVGRADCEIGDVPPAVCVVNFTIGEDVGVSGAVSQVD